MAASALLKLHERFADIASNYINGNLADYKLKLKSLSKANLIRFINYLRHEQYGLTIVINSNGQLILTEETSTRIY